MKWRGDNENQEREKCVEIDFDGEIINKIIQQFFFNLRKI